MNKKLKGIIVKKSSELTLSVKVDNVLVSRLYKKRYIRSKKYLVHDEKNIGNIGDEVIIEEVKPISKNKHFAIKEILNKNTK